MMSGFLCGRSGNDRKTGLNFEEVHGGLLSRRHVVKRLYRSNHDRMIAGVAGGMAEYFQVDTTIIRLAWIITFFMSFGIVAYIIAVFIIPPAPRFSGSSSSPGRSPHANAGPASSTPEPTSGAEGGSGGDTGSTSEDGRKEGLEPGTPGPSTYSEDGGEGRAVNGSVFFGWLLVGVGAFFIAERYIHWWSWHRLWPIFLIALGLMLIIDRRRGG